MMDTKKPEVDYKPIKGSAVAASMAFKPGEKTARREDEMEAGNGWPPDCRNAQEVIDKYKPEGMGNLEFLASIGMFDHEMGRVRSAPVEDILVGPRAPKEHKT
jgi:hypothetical protein